TTTTGTTLPPSPSLAVQGDKNEIVAALQFLINCSGSARLDVDGNFGPATRAALEQAQTRLGRPADGTLDEDTMAALARGCDQRRGLEDEGKTTIAGNAAPGDSEVFSVSLLTGSTVTAAFTRGGGLDLRLLGADGAEVPSQEPSRWEVDATQDYLLEVASPEEAVTFILVVEVAVATRPVGDWVLATDGLIYKGTKLALGSDAATVIGKVFDYLGHGVRGNLDEFDTDWYTITEPGDMGLRGIRIEGFALLFFGPDPNNPDRPETFRRHRFLGPTVDAAGNPRPRHYATTAEGITVGDTLADLKAVYGTRVTPGSNRDEHFYRLRGSPGVLCFYFDTDEAPADYSPITEIASECRSG
ncbi:MAG: peptidoglycan-binding protein, partial [Actinobacteria bacterium]|nr:peptidoglycan-binding protein [Actinomycetota bacterium]